MYTILISDCCLMINVFSQTESLSFWSEPILINLKKMDRLQPLEEEEQLLIFMSCISELMTEILDLHLDRFLEGR